MFASLFFRLLGREKTTQSETFRDLKQGHEGPEALALGPIDPWRHWTNQPMLWEE